MMYFIFSTLQQVCPENEPLMEIYEYLSVGNVFPVGSLRGKDQIWIMPKSIHLKGLPEGLNPASRCVFSLWDAASSSWEPKTLKIRACLSDSSAGEPNQALPGAFRTRFLRCAGNLNGKTLSGESIKSANASTLLWKTTLMAPAARRRIFLL